MIFSWDDWNIAHIATHGVTRAEAEYVVRHAEEPFPRQIGDEKLLVWGPTDHGRLLQVVFVFREPEDLDFESLTLDQWILISEGVADDIIYVVHSMPLSAKLLRQYSRLRR